MVTYTSRSLIHSSSNSVRFEDASVSPLVLLAWLDVCTEGVRRMKTRWERKTWRRDSGGCQSYSWWGNQVYFTLFGCHHDFRVGGDCRLRRHSSGTLGPGTGPFPSGCSCFTGNGGFGHGTEFPGDRETGVSGTFVSFVPLGGNEESGRRHAFSTALRSVAPHGWVFTNQR